MAKANAIPTIPAARLRVDPELRAQLASAAERIISILDQLDADPDLEPAGDEEDHAYSEGLHRRAPQTPFEDDEDGGDAEPSLAYPERCQHANLAGVSDEREWDVGDDQEEERGI